LVAYRAKPRARAGKAFAFAASGEGESLVVRYIRHHAVRQPGTGHGDGLFREQLFVPWFEPVPALLRRHSTGRAARSDGVDDCRRGGVAILALCEAFLQELELHVLHSLDDDMRVVDPPAEELRRSDGSDEQTPADGDRRNPAFLNRRPGHCAVLVEL